jgi:hypothetical protein
MHSGDGDIRTLAKKAKFNVVNLADLPLPSQKAQLDLQLNVPTEGVAKLKFPKIKPQSKRTAEDDHEPPGLFIAKARKIEADVGASASGQLLGQLAKPEPRRPRYRKR